MKGDGTVTWPALTFSATTPLRVLINRRPLHGSIEILVDGSLEMSAGKAAAQAGHASMLLAAAIGAPVAVGETETVEVDRTDHLGVLATVRLPAPRGG